MTVCRFRQVSLFIVLTGLAMTLFLCMPEPTRADTNTLVILDASGSMRGRIDSVVKMDMAKDAVCEYLERLPADMNVGLLVYGHRRRNDCTDMEYTVPLGTNNRDLLVRTVKNLKPMGKTPISLSLDKAVSILAEKQGTGTIVLVSDGKESCSAAPCELIEKHKEKGVQFICHVIGFDVDIRAKRELECIAQAGNGKYFDADGLSGFKIALENVTKEQPVAVAPPPKPAQPTRLNTGTLTLQKHQFTAGERIWVHFSTPDSYSDNAWIGIIPSDIPHGSEEINDKHDLTYKYLKKAQTGDLEFYAPGKPGAYDFRMHDTDNKGVEVASVSFTVVPGAASITLSKNALVCGEAFDVHFNAPGTLSPKAWVGIVPSDIPHGSEERNDKHDLSYKYLQGKPMGTLTFHAPSKPGNYDMRLHDTDNKGTEIGSVSFTVTMGSASLSLPRTQFQSGEKITVTFKTPANLSDNAWIGIIPSDIPHGQEARNDRFDVSYKYLKGKSSGTLEFIAPVKPGAYDFRLNDTDDNGNELASVSFQVVNASASLTLNKTVFSPGERIWVTFSTSVAFAGSAWVGIIPSDIPHGSEARNDKFDISYQYVKGKKQDTLEFKAPDKPGSYDFRLNDSDSNGKEIASVSFTVR